MEPKIRNLDDPSQKTAKEKAMEERMAAREEAYDKRSKALAAKATAETANVHRIIAIHNERQADGPVALEFSDPITPEMDMFKDPYPRIWGVNLPSEKNVRTNGDEADEIRHTLQVDMDEAYDRADARR